MPSVVASTVERSVLSGNAPAIAEVNATMRSANQALGGPYGNFVGAAPRITRDAVLSQSMLTTASSAAALTGNPLTSLALSAIAASQVGENEGFYTRVTQLYSWPDTEWSRQNDPVIRARIRSIVDSKLASLGGTWAPVVLVPYDPEFHGTPEWWQSGHAVTEAKYVNEWPITRSDIDNPFGPNYSMPPITTQAVAHDFVAHANDTAQAGAAAVREIAAGVNRSVIKPAQDLAIKVAIGVGVVSAVGAVIYFGGPPLVSWLATRKKSRD